MPQQAASLMASLEPSYWFTLDRDWTITTSSQPEAVGTRIWDNHPDTERECRPWHEYAVATGRTVEFRHYYLGVVWHIRSEPDGDGVRVTTWAVAGVTVKDLLTLESLVEATARVSAAILDCPGRRPGSVAAPPLPVAAGERARRAHLRLA